MRVKQTLLARFVTLLRKKAMGAMTTLMSTIVRLTSEQKYRSLAIRISSIPMIKSLFHLLVGLIVWPKGESCWSIKLLPEGFKIIAPHRDDAIGHITAIWRIGIYDRYKPGKGQVVFDLGAHIGIYAIKASKEVGQDGIIVAIEPHPTNFEFLRKNLELNECRNVLPINTAVASSCGKAALFLGASGVSHSTALRRSDDSILVNSITIDQLMKQLKLTRIELIKINVEGATQEVLRGAEETLKVHKPKIIAAIGHYPTEEKDVIQFLSDRDFLISTRNDFIYAEPKRTLI